MNYIFLIAGLALLVKGADYLIDGATSLAKRLRIPSLIIGLTVVAIGTSLPEFIINIFAAIRGATEIAFGNVVGSNITNTLLVLGTAAAIHPLIIGRSTVWKEIPFSLLAAIALFTLANIPPLSAEGTNFLTRLDGITLLLLLAIFLLYLYTSAFRTRTEMINEKLEIEVLSNQKTAIYILAGIIGLYLGGSWTVNGAVAIARNFGLSEFLIAATIIAFGTSLPELITSARAALRHDSDLAVGNVIGSNILNIFFVLAITSIISPVAIPESINIDLAFLMVSAILLFIFLFVGQKHVLNRSQGLIFILGYVFYILLSVFRGV